MKFTILAAASAAALFISSAAFATEIKYGAFLLPEASGATGSGWSSLDIDTNAKTMLVRVGFSGLSGNTTAAHVHGPTAEPTTGTAGVITQTPTFSGFPTGVKSGIYERLFDMSLASSYNPSFLNNATNLGDPTNAFNGLLGALADDKAYLNVHTATFASGEIRGFFKIVPPTPEPTSIAAIAGLAIVARRRR